MIMQFVRDSSLFCLFVQSSIGHSIVKNYLMVHILQSKFCGFLWFYNSIHTTYQADQPIPGYFSGNGNSCSKRKKIWRNQYNPWQMEDPTFATPVHEVHLEIAIELTLTNIPLSHSLA